MRPPDAIWHMRSYFSAPDHAVDAVTFANAYLRIRKRDAARQIADLGFVSAPLLRALDVDLGDPSTPSAFAVTAYVSGGVWIAKCECGGAEFVDFDLPLFMCSSCWNEDDGHAWRSVDLPKPIVRAAVEAVLLARPAERTRSWYVGQVVADLVFENEEHTIERGIEEAALTAVNAEEGVLADV